MKKGLSFWLNLLVPILFVFWLFSSDFSVNRGLKITAIVLFGIWFVSVVVKWKMGRAGK